MLAWVRRVLLHRIAPPDDQRLAKAAHLEEAEREVKAQTARIRRIRREAQVAELRLRGR